MSQSPSTPRPSRRTRGPDFSAGSSASHPPTTRRASRVVRAVGWLLLVLTALVLVVAGAAWWWTGNQTSLASALQQAARYLPADQQLESRDVTGALRSGGRIGWLRWRSPSLAVEVTDLQLGWQLAPLLRSRFELGTVHAARVQITPYATAESTPPTPLTQIVLPLEIGVPFKIDVIDWAGPPPVQALDLAGNYRFDGQQHRLVIDSLNVAQGQYSARATLQALSPMAVDAAVQGIVQTTVPGGGAPLPLVAAATLKGTLATAAAQLQAQVQISPAAGALATTALPAAEPHKADGAAEKLALKKSEKGTRKIVIESSPHAKSSTNPDANTSVQSNADQPGIEAATMHAKVQATLAPWAPQPLLAADATLSNVNLAALWPQAPATLLQGTLKAGPLPNTPAQGVAPALSNAATPTTTATPDPTVPSVSTSTGWAIEADVRNALAGPWDKARLPLSALQASAYYDGARWVVPNATFTTDASSGGGTARGQYTPATGAVEGEATLRALRPGSLHTAMDASLSSALSGTLSASTQGNTVRFKADIRAASGGAPRSPASKSAPALRTATLRINTFTAQGRWQPPAAIASPPASAAAVPSASQPAVMPLTPSAASPANTAPIASTKAAAPTAPSGGILHIDQLLLDALDTRVEASALQVSPATLSGQGQLRIAAPGITAQADGRMAPRSGAGNVQLQWADTARTQRWLTTLPWVGNSIQSALQGASAQGAAQLTAKWQGGWQTLVDQLNAVNAMNTAKAGSAGPAGKDRFELQATLGIAKMDLKLPAKQAADTSASTVQAIELRDVAAELSGNLAQASLTLNAQARAQTTSPAGSAPAQQLRAGVQTRLSGGLTSAGQWQAQITALRLQVQNTVGTANAANGVTPRAAAPWVLELTDAVTVTANTHGTAATTAGTANAANAIKASGKSAPLKAQASAGSARVTGPLPGTVMLRWQPVQLALGTAPAALPQLQTQGTLQGLPMAWVDALGLNNRKDAVDGAAGSATASNPAQPLLQSMGLATSLVFDGQWNVDTTTPNALKASASLRRTSGDLRILAGDATAVTAVQSSGQGTGAGTATAVATEASQAAAAPGAGLPAGVRQAELSVQAQGQVLSARLQWASDRAGEVDARVSTRLTFNSASPAPSAPTAPGARGATAAAPASPGAAAAPSKTPATASATTATPTPTPAPSPAPSAITLAPNAPIEGTVRARLPDVGVWGMLAPPGWRVRGTLDANATLSGTLDAPRWTGTLGADDMAVRSVIDGLDLQGGRLRATLRGNQIDITELRLQGGRGSSARITGYSGNLTAAAQDGGTLTGSGSMNWTDRADGASGLSGIRMALQAEAKGLQVLTRADRQISVSGPLQASLEQGQIRLRGKLTVDRATIILPDETAPSLGSDVVVRSRAKARADQAKVLAAAQASQAAGQVQAAKPPDIAITLNLGRDFALQGQGITTRLVGELDIRGSTVPGAPPRIIGEVRTEQGRYRAWGQMLDVETGLIRFSGPYNNPSLDILALRPNISVRAGVQVTGSAQAPRVKLYSDPDLPDAEKLSWVVLGRSAAGGGAEAAVLQQAALALLGRNGGGGGGVTANIASRLGLDEIGVKGPGAGEDATAAALTFGKRLSKDLYLTYERSLSGTLGTLYIFYDLSRRLTLRGQTGEKSAVDLIYTRQYD